MKLKVGLILLQLCPSFVLGEDWPTWRGAKGDGSWQATVSRVLPDQGLSMKWKANLEPGYSG